MSKRQTAVDWLHGESNKLIHEYIDDKISTRDLIIKHHNLYYDAKRMMQEQIIDAFHSKKIINTISAEQYYQETYGGDHE